MKRAVFTLLLAVSVVLSGREYLLSTQELDIYRTAAAYEGRVFILHCTKDGIVPRWCSERYQETYGERSEFILVEDENHMITRRKEEVVGRTVSFFENAFPGTPKA